MNAVVNDPTVETTPTSQETSTNSSGVVARRDPSVDDSETVTLAAQQTDELMKEFDMEEMEVSPATPTPPAVPATAAPTSNEAPATPPVVPTTPAPATPPPTAVPAPAPAAAVPVPASPTPPAAATPPVAAPVAAPAPASAPETPPTGPKPMSDAEVQEWMNKSTTDLAQNFYKFSDEDMEQFDTNPRDFLAKQLAKTHLTVLTSVSQALMAVMPDMLRAVQVRENDWKAAEERFYDTWPGLKAERAKVHADAIRLAVDYRNRNPQADEATLIRDVGAHVHIMHQIPLPQAIQQDSTPPAPYVPASGAPAPAARSSAPANQWDQLAREFLEEDIR